MGVPKRRTSTHRKGKRRASVRLRRPTLVACPECGQVKPPHQACPSCGTYKTKTAPHIDRSKKKDERSPRPKTQKARKSN